MNDQEITLLLKKANKSLQAANLMLDSNLSDFAVARAYYTMFYIAQAFLLSKGWLSRHHGVKCSFMLHFGRKHCAPTEQIM